MPSKSEGAFYIWTDAEIDALLGADADLVRDAASASSRTAMRRRIRTGSSRGQNLLYIAESDRRASPRRTGRTADEVSAALVRARAILLAARAQRGRARTSTTRS